MADIFNYFDWTDMKFNIAILAVAFNPLFWNIVGRWEHRTRFLTKLFGSPFTACYSVAVIILLLNFYRSYSFTEAMKIQPKIQVLDSAAAYYIGLGLLLIGTILVLSSFFALGFIGTFLEEEVLDVSKRVKVDKSPGPDQVYPRTLWEAKEVIAGPLAEIFVSSIVTGDYFGVLMEAKILSFPFNLMENPMYWGSTLVYLGWAVMNASPTGLVLTAWVAAVYKVAILVESPFTDEVYRQKEKVMKEN
ncbi:phosphatidylethanolamine N-methyltransferase isoform X1 [Chiloscyllium punctatum]|uniref:phosphatidylethanolamine N-methyltransferase isoform X1 n=1 Tax=Chiloscyllium punctatum TaxID=137246 RepID=UPI003B6401D4